MKKALSLVLTLILVFGLSVQAFALTKEEKINAAKLSPQKTGFTELDTAVQKVLDEIIKPEMTQYQKLVAIYNYCTTSFTYDGDMSSTPAKPCPNGTEFCNVQGPHTESECSFTFELEDSSQYKDVPNGTYLMSPEQIRLAEKVLRTKEGVCDHYAAAFSALANAVGFRTYVVSGDISYNGSLRGHVWNYVVIGDYYYLFDTQAEQVNMKDGKIQYHNFMISPSSTSYKLREESYQASKDYRSAYLKNK